MKGNTIEARYKGGWFVVDSGYMAWSCTIPQLKNTFILAFISGIIFSFAAFPQQYVMTEGGPGRSTEVLALLIYKQAFEFTKFGYSSAISVAFFFSLLIFSLIQFKIFKSETEF